MQEKSVIITAGGLGKRMKSTLPKQFIVLGNKPLLMHTIQLFYKFDHTIEIILALPKDWVNYWQELQVEYNFKIPHTIVIGGEERFHTVQNALEKCTGKFIAVHDGVRPFVSNETLISCFEVAQKLGNAVPSISVSESMRKVENSENTCLDRNQVKVIQTPQCFQIGLLKKAFLQTYLYSFTDDATVVEAIGEKINLVEGNAANIKITTPYDLKIAEVILSI